MSAQLQKLGQLLFNSIPTIILFVLLHFYLKRVLYRPLRQVLAARAARIEGRQEAAQKLLAEGEAKLASYEDSLRQQRMENYRHIESRRQAGLAESQKALVEARQKAAQALVEARQQLAAETAQVRAQLQGSAEELAGQIMTQVLRNSKSSGKTLMPGASA